MKVRGYVMLISIFFDGKRRWGWGGRVVYSRGDIRRLGKIWHQPCLLNQQQSPSSPGPEFCCPSPPPRSKCLSDASCPVFSLWLVQRQFGLPVSPVLFSHPAFPARGNIVIEYVMEFENAFRYRKSEYDTKVPVSSCRVVLSS